MKHFSELPKSYLIVLCLLAIVSIGSLSGMFVFYSKYQTLQNPEKVSEAELREVVARVGRFLVLPEDETPTIATVTDPEKLKDQPFFANAQAGDKVLIYSKSRKAILWRPSAQKIIELSALSIGQDGSVGITPR